MSRTARQYDIYVPLTYNDGRPISDDQLLSVERRLLARFSGVTSIARQSPLRGTWIGETQVYFDSVIVISTLDFRPRGSTTFIAHLKRDLLREFEQLEIFITELALRVH